MSKKNVYFLFIIVMAVTVFLVGCTTSSKPKPHVERFEDGRLGVEMIVVRPFDLEDMTFTCSAVFKIEENTATGEYYIKNVSSQFIQRKRVPIEYILFSEYDIRTKEIEPGRCFELEQTFIVSRNGKEIGPLTVAARFSVDPDTGKMLAEDVLPS